MHLCVHPPPWTVIQTNTNNRYDCIWFSSGPQTSILLKNIDFKVEFQRLRFTWCCMGPQDKMVWSISRLHFIPSVTVPSITFSPLITSNQRPRTFKNRGFLKFPLWLSKLRIWLVSVRMQVQSLTSLSGLRIWHCHKLQCRLQIQLGSTVAVAQDSSCSSDPTPKPRNFHM